MKWKQNLILMAEFIVSNFGGFGNHIRWLVLLDKKYFLHLPVIDLEDFQKTYNLLKGSDWPDSSDVSYRELLFCKPEARAEIYKHFSFLRHNREMIFKSDSVQEKVKFILENVYFLGRTWHNWLTTELSFHFNLNKYVKFGHFRDLEDINYESYKKILMTTTDPFTAYKSYLKFNINLDLQTKDSFLEKINQQNKLALAEKRANVLSVDSTILFQQELDKKFYYQLVDWFELTDNYEYAKVIHERWFCLHKQAEKDIVKYFTEIYHET